MGKGGQFPILGQIQPQAAGYLPDGPGLRRPADPGHRQAHIHRRPDADIEQFRLQVNLPVGDGNYISGNVGGHIPGLGFNDGQGGNGAAAVFGIQPRRPFQQTAVQIENIPRISLPAGRPAQQQGHLPISPGVLGQVIIDHQHIPPLRHKLLSHRAAGIGGDELQRRGIGGPGIDHDGMGHRIIFLEDTDHLRHFALFLPDGYIDANQVAAALIDDGIQGNGRLAGRTVADNQFPLPPANGNHRIDGLDAGLHRGIYRLPHHHIGGGLFHRAGGGGIERPPAVQRPAHRIHDPANQSIAYRHLDNLAGGAYLMALFDGGGIAQDGRAHQIRLQVQGQPQDIAAEVQQFVGADALQALDAGNAVADLHHGAYIHQAQVAAKLLNLAPD